MSETDQCRVCGSFEPSLKVSVEACPEADGALVHCPRCGDYTIDRERLLEAQHGILPEQAGLRVSALARERSEACKSGHAERCLHIDASDRAVQELLLKAPRRPAYAALVDRIVYRFSMLAEYPGRPSRFCLLSLAAEMVLPSESIREVLIQLRGDGLLQGDPNDMLRHQTGQRQGTGTPGTRFVERLTSKGWRRADELGRGVAGDRAFVAMSFATELKPAYSNGIRPALLECGFRAPFRTDDPEHQEQCTGEYVDRIDDRVLAGIRVARCVVVDATRATNNVSYEAGFAEGLDIERIWTCREDCVEALSFDTRQMDHLTWSKPEELREKLINRLRARGLALRTD